MDLRLLQVKLTPQPFRPDLILRRRLIDRLEVCRGFRLALISAPPGYGKTSLVTGWLSHVVSQPAHQTGFAWLALDEADNDPQLFFSYLLAAVQRLAPELVSSRTELLLSSPQLPLSRLRVRREMVEIREADLRFSLEEALAFLSQTMHLQLSEEAVSRLLDRTEGFQPACKWQH